MADVPPYRADRSGSGFEEILVLEGGPFHAHAKVFHTIGGNFAAWTLRDPVTGETLDILEAPVDHGQLSYLPTSFGTPVLLPFPNRLRDGRFESEGRVHQVEVDPRRGHAIHGAVRSAVWAVDALEADAHGARAVLSQALRPETHGARWPFALDARLTYEIREAEVRLTLDLHNVDAVAQPWGYGLHPYFRMPWVPGGAWEDYTLEIPCAGIWKLDADLLPTGEVEPVAGELDYRSPKRLRAGEPLDHVFTGISRTDARGWSAVRLRHAPTGLELEVAGDPQVREWVVYVPKAPRSSIAVEPYTCTTDAFNLSQRGVDAGRRELAPGATARVEVAYRLHLPCAPGAGR